MRSYLRDPARPVVFVPIYFGYERLVEGRTYIGELSGPAEGEGDRSSSLLQHDPGAAQPLRQGLRELRRAAAARPADPEARAGLGRASRPGPERHARRGSSPLVRELATGIMTRINAAACVTPINLIGARAARDAAPEHGRGRPRAAARAVRVADAPGAVLAAASGSRTHDGAAMIRYGESLGILRRQPHELGDVRAA
ncbi:MAG: hypothetical protein MZW92_07840 [Comamonadaceae bacterium]|nr:hypothetical protein [Comamonadaceae bacterium]